MDRIPHGHPIPAEVWANATAVLAEYVNQGERFLLAGKPKDGPIFDKYIKKEMVYNEMADAIWFADWTPEQRAKWSRLWEVNSVSG